MPLFQRRTAYDPPITPRRLVRSHRFSGRLSGHCFWNGVARMSNNPENWADLRNRILSRCTIEGCWVWNGALDNSGYARMSFNGKNCRVSRLAWSAFNNQEWPAPLHALHSCDNRKCVNPAHISPGTNAENTRQMCERGRHAKQQVTHCPYGHEYTPENTKFYGRGRACAECSRIRARVTNLRAKYRRRGMALPPHLIPGPHPRWSNQNGR